MKLKELRGELSQREIALLLKVEQRTYANYENEKTQPDIKFLKDAANFYNVSLDFLLDHKTKNTLEIGHLSDIKKELINLIYSATDNDCKMLEAYYLGMQEAKNQNTYQNLIKKGE